MQAAVSSRISASSLQQPTVGEPIEPIEVQEKLRHSTDRGPRNDVSPFKPKMRSPVVIARVEKPHQLVGLGVNRRDLRLSDRGFVDASSRRAERITPVAAERRSGVPGFGR